MKNYEDNNNILREMILSQEGIMAVEQDEFELYRAFLEDKRRNRKFSIDQFRPRLAVKKNNLYNLISPFFYNERFLNYTKLSKITIRIALDDTYEDILVSLSKPIIIFEMIQLSASHILNLTLKYLKNTQLEFAKVNEKSEIFQISDEHPDNERSMLFIRKNFKFEMTDISFLMIPTKSRYSKYIQFDEVIMSPPSFIENNEVNKKSILGVIKKHGLGTAVFVKGMKFTESEVKKIIIPAIPKTRTSFMNRANKESIFIRLLETQSHLKDETIIDIISHMSGNKPFMRKLKSSKRIAKIYKNRPTIMLFIVVS